MPCAYTIGTWRVSRAAYIDQLCKLGVKRLIDVRGNPWAGRQEDLKRSRGLEKALASVGIVYEYWGRELGEDALDANRQQSSSAFAQCIRELVDACGYTTTCLLGHLHEAQGCHRLELCNRMLETATATAARDPLEIRHLLWIDHQSLRDVAHKQVADEAIEVVRFFSEKWQLAELVRQTRSASSPSQNLTTVPWESFNSSLFSDGKAYRFVLPFDTEIYWYPRWLSKKEADALEDTIQGKVTFLHPTYMFQNPDGGFTKTLIKRGQMRICGDDCIGAVAAQSLEQWSNQLLRKVEDASGCPFNCFVANHYANGRVVINWHSDSGPGDDEGLGPNPHIGSLSLGASRNFSLKSKRKVNGRMVHLDIPLIHGSLLVMGKNSQTHWLHALLADESCTSPRVNLTFRFYARESTKHIEGLEHNHEWEAAPESVRVRLHRDPCGKPILVDIPEDMNAKQLPKYLTAVMPGARRFMSVAVCGDDGSWHTLPPNAVVSKRLRKNAADRWAEVKVGPT